MVCHPNNDGDDLKALQEKIRQLELDNVELIEEIDRLSRMSSGSDFTTKVKDLEIDGLKAEIEKLNDKCRKSDQNLTMLKTQVEKSGSLTAQYEELRNEIDIEVDAKRVLEQRLQKQLEESSQVKSELLESRSELNRLRMECSRAKSDHESSLQHISALKEEISNLTNAKSLQLSTLENRCKDVENEKVSLDHQVKHLFNEVNSKIQLENQLKMDVFNLERRLSHAEAENAALKQRTSELEGKERSLIQLTHNFDALKAELRDLTMDNAALRASASSAPSYRPAPSLPVPALSSYNNSASNNIGKSNSFDNYVAPPIPTPLLSSHRYGAASVDKTSSLQSSSQMNAYPPRPESVPVSVGHHGALSPPSIRGDLLDHSGKIDIPRPSNNRSSLGGGGGGAQSLSSLLGKSASSNRYSLGGGDQNNGNINRPIEDTASLSITGGSMRRSFQNPESTPFATEQSGAALNSAFEKLDRKLTELMVEKTSLAEESERLHQRGSKNLKDRTRLSIVEQRLTELSKEISSTRKLLLAKPS